jgi:uncharacterized protein
MIHSEEPVSFSNARGQILKGVVHRPRSGDFAKAAVLCHGMESNKESEKIVALGRELADRGVGVLRFDFSYCGESDGRFEDITYSGEVDDLAAAFDVMLERGARKIAILGSSMGGTVALLFAAGRPQVAALVTVAAPVHPEKIAEELLSPQDVKRWRDAGHISYHGRRLNRSLLDDLQKIDVPAAAKKILCPVLIIHGDRDETVPVEEAYELHGLLRHDKRLSIVQDGDHRFSHPLLLKKLLDESTE